MEQLVQLAEDRLPIPKEFQPYVAAAILLVCAFAFAIFAAVYAGVFIFMERRIAGRIMSRIGPNRVGPQGLFQFVADAVKLIVKEDIIPTAADRPLFKLAPYLMFSGVVAGFAVLPFSRHIIGTDLNIGILYVLAITSVTVVGVLMSGWASNSKWALFGGMRAAAQLVSYEIPSALALLPGVLLAGTMSTQGIIEAQTGSANAHWVMHGGVPWNWFIFHSPMMVILFVVFFVAQLAEGARIPFDLPEGESELVSGYNTEYSGFRFGAYFTAEFANTWIAAALGVIVFLGGWQIPFVLAPTGASASWTVLGTEIADPTLLAALLLEAASFLFFFIKIAALVFIIIQLRWTIPRVRIDQMMSICWKYLLPITFVCIFLILGWMIYWPWDELGSLIWRFAMLGLALIGLVAYIRRVRFNIVQAGDHAFWHWRI